MEPYMKLLLEKKISMFLCFLLCTGMLLTGCGRVCGEGNGNGEGEGDMSEAVTPAVSGQASEDDAADGKDTVQNGESAAGQGKDQTDSEEARNYAQIYASTGELPSLAEVYKDQFLVGAALSKADILNKNKAELIAYQFNSLTTGNEMKADNTLDINASQALGDEEYPVVNMGYADALLSFAKEHGMKMRGHTLIWHQQTPRWLFTVGFSARADAPLVTREVMLARMENYIKQELEYVNRNYPGIVYAWDVVNEAISPEDGHEKGIRTANNLWYEVIGEDYIEMAFTFARKYAAPEQKLFYNDYNTYEKERLFQIIDLVKELKEKGIIDGIGMQDHLKIDYPNTIDYQYAINKYAELGLELQVTELDIDTLDETESSMERLAIRYRSIMNILLSSKEKGQANITSVTFWGLTDDGSWLNNDGIPSYPLLFTKELKPKRAFFGVLLDDSVNLIWKASDYTDNTASSGDTEDEPDYEAMIKRSLITAGNNYRMKQVLEKASSGKEVNIAYIGGSVTEGAGATNNTLCYAYQSYLSFLETYGEGDKNKIKFINAGMSGTPSNLGVIRYDRDVTGNGSVQPDIVFIEFAVNDYQEPTGGEAYESLIRKILNAPNQPAVVLLFSVFKTKWNMQEEYKPLGYYYELPMISILDAVVPELTAGRMTDAEFFADEYHPKDYGHKIMADSISYYYKTVEQEQASASDNKIPSAPKIGDAYEGIRMLDSSSKDNKVVIKKGGFTSADSAIGGFQYDFRRKTFPNNWMHGASDKQESFVMTLNCKNLMLVYKASSSNTFGTAEVYIDGKFIKSINGFQSGGWNNPVTELLLDEDNPAEHTIEIRMAKDSQDKNFTIMAFGYTQ
jgi:endo-1,4-beta-xylanase